MTDRDHVHPLPALPRRAQAPAGFPSGFDGPDQVEAEDRRRIIVLDRVVAMIRAHQAGRRKRSG